MPWDRNDDAPVSVRRVLPEAAVTIGRRAANAAWKRGESDEAAMVAFWSAVKAAGYRKAADGRWVHRDKEIEREARRGMGGRG
jgi:cation transport regulator ChaB